MFALPRWLEDRIEELQAENQKLREEMAQRESAFAAERERWIARCLGVPERAEMSPNSPAASAGAFEPLWTEAQTLDPYSRAIARGRAQQEEAEMIARGALQKELQSLMVEAEASRQWVEPA